MTIRWIELDKIRLDLTQTRFEIRPKAVEEYKNSLDAGDDLDPAIVFYVDGELHMAAGHHRHAAYKRAGKSSMPCEVREGTLWDAIECGIRDNLKHKGERLTAADKAHAIRLVLKEKSEFSNVTIAEICGSSDKTVAKVRRQMESTSEIPKSDYRTGRDGRTIKALGIGHHGAKRQESDEIARCVEMIRAGEHPTIDSNFLEEIGNLDVNTGLFQVVGQDPVEVDGTLIARVAGGFMFCRAFGGSGKIVYRHLANDPAAVARALEESDEAEDVLPLVQPFVLCPDRESLKSILKEFHDAWHQATPLEAA